MGTFIRCKITRLITLMEHFFQCLPSRDLIFPLVLMIQIYDYFWKPISPFSNFFQIIWFLMLYTVYCNVCSLIDISGHCQNPCRCSPCLKRKCVSGLQSLERKLEFFEMHTSLGPGTQKLLRHKWRKLYTLSFYNRCVGGCN